MAHVSKGCAQISSLVPNPDDLLALEVEEIAGMLLEHLNSCYPNEPDPRAGWQLHRHNFFHNLTPYSIVRGRLHGEIQLRLHHDVYRRLAEEHALRGNRDHEVKFPGARTSSDQFGINPWT